MEWLLSHAVRLEYSENSKSKMYVHHIGPCVHKYMFKGVSKLHSALHM